MKKTDDIAESGTRYVMIQYNCIPHYRARLFELLSASESPVFEVVADDESETRGMKTVTMQTDRVIRRKFGKNHIFRGPFGVEFYWQPAAVREMLRLRPESVIALGSPYCLTTWILGLIGRFLRTPVFFWGHGLLDDEVGPKWWFRKAFYVLASGHLVYGEKAKTLLERKGFDSKNVHVVYNSLDYDRQIETRNRIGEHEKVEFLSSVGLAAGIPAVIFSGRLEPRKRVDLLIRAVALLKSQNVLVQAIIIGDGTHRIACEDLAGRLSVSELILFFGACYDEEVIGLAMASSDLCVIPAGAGLSVLHAMVYGTPVAVHNRSSVNGPEVEAVAEGVNGFFYEADDLGSLASVIQKAVALSPEERFRMRKRCTAIIDEKYNPHRQVETFVNAVNGSVRDDKSSVG